MSEKTRKKKDGEDKNNQRMREVNADPGKKNLASSRQEKAGSGQGKD